VIVLPVEGRPFAFLDAASFEEEERVALELTRSGLLHELVDTLELLLGALDRRACRAA
jgi:hypothetical protein